MTSTISVSRVKHQLHHSKSREHFDKNFGFIFALSDELIGTHYVPGRSERWKLGLPPDSGKYDLVWSLHFYPFTARVHLLAIP